jgi:hypothetical protein
MQNIGAAASSCKKFGTIVGYGSILSVRPLQRILLGSHVVVLANLVKKLWDIQLEGDFAPCQEISFLSVLIQVYIQNDNKNTV